MTDFSKSPGILALVQGKAVPSSSNILDRVPARPSPALSPAQSLVDRGVSDFTRHATDAKTFVTLVAAGGAYRLGRLGVLSADAAAFRGLPLKIVSVTAGLGAEVAVFEIGNRGLDSTQQNPWRWDGTYGMRQGIVNSFITFGTLKGAGRLAQGENILIQHFLQDSAMVAGHQASWALGWGVKPEGNLAERFFNAEATNLQLAGAMALGRSMTLGKLEALERGADYSILFTSSKKEGRNPFQNNPYAPVLAMAGRAPGEEREIPTIIRMLSLGGGGERTSSPEAVNPFEAKKVENQAWTSRSRQVPLENPSFPKKLIRAIQKSILRSNGDAFEHGALALQVGDTVIVYEKDITSNHPKEVGGESYREAILYLMGKARFLMAQERGKPIRIFMFHTHPRQDTHPGSFIQTPIYEHRDGESFTHINGQDCRAAESILKVMVPYLREYNYTGPIEIVAGAVPARTGTESKNPYIATYVRGIEAGRGFSESTPPKSDKSENPFSSGEDLRVRISPYLGTLGTPEAGLHLYKATVVENLPSDSNGPRQIRITFVENPSKDREGDPARKVYVFTLDAKEAERAGLVTLESDDLARLKYSYLNFELKIPEQYPPSIYQVRPASEKAEGDHPIFINEWCWDVASQRFVHIHAQLDPAIYEFRGEETPEGPVMVVTGPNGFHVEISDKLIKVFPF